MPDNNQNQPTLGDGLNLEDVEKFDPDQVREALLRVLRPTSAESLDHKDHGSHSNDPG
jgi:hypothetical protein